MRYRNYDCARGVAAIIVLLYHIPLVFNDVTIENFAYTLISFPTKFGEQSVYFFMGLSGYVLALASNKFMRVNFFSWAGWRMIRLLPMYYSCYFLGYLLIENANIRWVDLTHLYLFSNNNIYSGINPPLWSLSVEIFISIVLYPLLTKINPKLVLSIALILFLFSYSSSLWGLIAILRSMAAFLVGVAVVSINFSLSKNQKITAAIFIIAWSILILVDKRILNSLLIPIIFVILILLKNAKSIILVNKITIFLGKYSFSLYATHWVTLELIDSYIKNLHWVLIYSVSCFSAILISVCVGKIIEFPTRKLSSIFIHRFKNAP
jgi:peptidoglycan/LPS O-acetylase OafA/YrhL